MGCGLVVQGVPELSSIQGVGLGVAVCKVLVWAER